MAHKAIGADNVGQSRVCVIAAAKWQSPTAVTGKRNRLKQKCILP